MTIDYNMVYGSNSKYDERKCAYNKKNKKKRTTSIQHSLKESQSHHTGKSELLDLLTM